MASIGANDARIDQTPFVAGSTCIDFGIVWKHGLINPLSVQLAVVKLVDPTVRPHVKMCKSHAGIWRASSEGGRRMRGKTDKTRGKGVWRLTNMGTFHNTSRRGRKKVTR